MVTFPGENELQFSLCQRAYELSYWLPPRPLFTWQVQLEDVQNSQVIRFTDEDPIFLH
jgi:hypothetical protein